jgi:hypothetical protein
MALMANIFTIMALMANITFKPVEADWVGASPFTPLLEVYLDGRYAGTIFRRDGAPSRYFYQPRGNTTPSKDYPTLDELKASLQGS